MTHQVESVMNQRHLEGVLRVIFRGEEIVSNARRETDVKSPSTNYFLEADVWVPKFSLCFEFQDPYHYVSTWESQHSLITYNEADSEKHGLFRTRGETVIAVPCWWMGDVDSLVATLKFQRPDMNYLGGFNDQFPIPLNHPIDFFKDLTLSSAVPLIGEPMLASFMKNNTFKISAKNTWWMGEKYDGMRFCWISKLRRLYSRNGLRLHIPNKMYNFLMDSAFIDGELWFGRSQFAEVHKLLSSQESSVEWQQLKLIAFDDPNPIMQNLPFEKRYASVLLDISKDNPIVVVATRMLCKNKKQLAFMLQRSIDEGGEGVILRKPGSLYEHGRSQNLIKLKATRGDDEALVVEVEEASLLLQLPNGITFRAPVPLASDHIGTEPIKKGDIVTFLFESYSTNSIPNKPEISRVRRDKTWTHVVRDFAETSKQNVLNLTSHNVISHFTPKRPYFWTSGNRRNLRVFFENFAKSRNFDPLVPANWYSLKNKDIEQMKGGETVLKKFNSSLSTAISQLFPEIGIVRSSFKNLYQGYWFDVANRRKYFIEYATKNKFDPFKAENWYNILKENINTQGGRRLLDYYPGSNVRLALVHVFPEVHFDMDKFPIKNRYYWRDRSKRRAFFVQFANDRNFDPLVPEKWYLISQGNILATKGGYGVMEYYDKDHRKALLDLFPEIGLDIKRFLWYRK